MDSELKSKKGLLSPKKRNHKHPTRTARKQTQQDAQATESTALNQHVTQKPKQKRVVHPAQPAAKAKVQRQKAKASIQQKKYKAPYSANALAHFNPQSTQVATSMEQKQDAKVAQNKQDASNTFQKPAPHADRTKASASKTGKANQKDGQRPNSLKKSFRNQNDSSEYTEQRPADHSQKFKGKHPESQKMPKGALRSHQESKVVSDHKADSPNYQPNQHSTSQTASLQAAPHNQNQQSLQDSRALKKASSNINDGKMHFGSRQVNPKQTKQAQRASLLKNKESKVSPKVNKKELKQAKPFTPTPKQESVHSPLPCSANTDNLPASQPRLNKAIAQSGFCSRRKADTLIFAGKVLVNHTPCLNPSTRLEQGDTIEIDGQILNWHTEQKYYLMLNKPIHTVSTAHDPEGRTTVIDLLPEQFQKIRVFPVGRLDYFSEGLLILTNDGALTNMLIHPRFHLPKIYHVTVRGDVPDAYLERMRHGMTLQDGEKLQPMQVTAASTEHGNTLLKVTLYQGINRQIRRVCADLNLTILRLVRVAQGPLTLGDLKLGEIRELTLDDVNALKAACTTQQTSKIRSI